MIPPIVSHCSADAFIFLASIYIAATLGVVATGCNVRWYYNNVDELQGTYFLLELSV